MEDRRALARRTKPIPCYAVEQLPPKHGGDALYESIGRDAVAQGRVRLVQEFLIPACDARSWTVTAGQLFRIVCSHGPQVADLNCWNRHNPRERFYSAKTRQLHATHLNPGDRLWSNMPYLRPLATMTYDTIRYGWDDDGAGVHDVIGSRCDPYTHCLLTHQDNTETSATTPVESHVTCHSNLTRQCLRDGLTEMDVHDVLNVFMCTGFTLDTHQYFTKPSPVQVGDYVEFLAETDLRVAASTCPQGDVGSACGDTTETPRTYPLTVQVFDWTDAYTNYLTDAGWQPSTVNGYSQSHGLATEGPSRSTTATIP
jgi:uncharacterized protein YcgI (DUF1989 family)